MEKDAHNFVKVCQECQVHANLRHVPVHSLQPVSSPWPFSFWGLDLVGKIHLPSSDGHTFIITATEYFTKWVEAAALTRTTGKVIAQFILNHLVCRFGIPQVIISDNGTPFKNRVVAELCDRLHIQQRFSSPYYPQANGQAEASNKTLVKVLAKTVKENYRDWHLKLYPALWAYRTSVRTATGATPYSLVYGSEAVLPLEVEIPSLRISLQGILTDEELRESRLAQLETLDERRLAALESLRSYQARLKRSFDKKVKLQSFEVGSLVLRQSPSRSYSKAPSDDGTASSRKKTRPRGKKFEPNWIGPYVVISVTRSGAYHLQTLEGVALRDPVNGLFLRRYFGLVSSAGAPSPSLSSQ